jgi:AcrR family transcriptional regulator
MARTLDPAAHAVRRDTFLDAAQGLIQTKGYEQMSVQDVLAEVGTSKGAFYHYFDSKAALLEGVIDRMVVVATSTLQPLLDDPDRTALEKFNGMFQGLASWKTQRRDLLVAVLQTWLSDDNAIVREKFRAYVATRMSPFLAPIIRQGAGEGSMAVDDPEAAAVVVVSLVLGVNELASRLFVAHRAGTTSIESIIATFRAYAAALERILGLPRGSLHLVDEDTLRWWFDQPVKEKE